MKDPNYPRALRIETAVDRVVSEVCLRQEILDAALKAMAPQQLAAAETILKVSPEDETARRLRAKLRALTGDVAGAVEDYTAAMKMGFEASDYFERAMLHKKLGDSEAAETDLSHAASLELSNDTYYRAYLDTSLVTIADLLADRPDDIELLYHRGARALALGDVATARRDYARATAVAPNDPVCVEFGEVVARYKALGLPEPIAASSVTPGKAVEADGVAHEAEKMADRLPWEDALVARAAATLRHDFGFHCGEEEMEVVRQGLQAVRADARTAVSAFFAQACTPELLAHFKAFLKGPQGTLITGTILPWVDALQLRQDIWADGIRSDQPLAVAVPLPERTPALRAMMQALLPDRPSGKWRLVRCGD